MRFVLVYQHFSVGGAGSSKAYELARYLAGEGHDVTVVCSRAGVEAAVDVPAGSVVPVDLEGFTALCIDVRYGQEMSFLRRLLSFLSFTARSMWVVWRVDRYDTLLASSTPLTIGLVGLVSTYLRRLPWVFEIRDLWPECPHKNGFLKSKTLVRVATLFEEWFYRKAESVCAISQMMVDRLVERGFPPEKLRFIPTGADLATFDSARPSEEFRRANDLEGKWVAAYVGTHGRANGLDYLVEAAPHFAGMDDVRLVLIGQGTETARLKAEAEERGLTVAEGGPLLFHAPVPKGDVPGILKACDAMLMNNVDRPGMKILMPNKFFDYLAAGRPLITNIDAETTDYIREAECGLLSDPGDPSDLVRVVRELRTDEAGAERMGRNARDLCARLFDRANLHRTWETVLTRAAGAKT